MNEETNNQKDKKSWYHILTLIVALATLIVAFMAFVISRNAINDNNKKEEQKEQIEKLIQEANHALLYVDNDGDYEGIVKQYKEIQKLNPNNNTGCEKFLGKVMDMLNASEGVCDDNIKKMLEYARELSVSKKDIGLINLEKRCNE